jgi:hypothetical protein
VFVGEQVGIGGLFEQLAGVDELITKLMKAMIKEAIRFYGQTTFA